jgi:hypothetical protein
MLLTTSSSIKEFEAQKSQNLAVSKPTDSTDTTGYIYGHGLQEDCW